MHILLRRGAQDKKTKDGNRTGKETSYIYIYMYVCVCVCVSICIYTSFWDEAHTIKNPKTQLDLWMDRYSNILIYICTYVCIYICNLLG